MSITKTILICTLLTTGCATGGVCKKIKTPLEPKVLPVAVKNGTISGKDLDNAIENHINAHKYIEELKKLGGFTK